MKIKCLIILLFVVPSCVLSQVPTKENSALSQKEVFDLRLEIDRLKNENNAQDQEISKLEAKIETDVQTEKENIIDRMNLYILFVSIFLALLGAAVNFFGKSAIKKRVEEIIQDTAEVYAEKKTVEVLNSKLTDEYISKIIRKRGEAEIEKLLKELDEKGTKTINDIRSKGDEVINSILAKPPHTESAHLLATATEQEIKENKEMLRANELFNLAYKSNDQKIKIDLYLGVLEIQPDNFSAMNNLGVAFNETYQFHEAIEWFTKAVSISPSYGLAYANRANSYNKMERLDEALRDANTAIAVDPKAEWAYAVKGNVLTKQGKFIEAEASLNKAIEINPNSASAYFNRAYFNEETGNYIQSEKDYLKAEELGHENVGHIYNNMAVLYRRTKEFDKAIAYIEKARNANPDYPNIDGTLSLIYADQGDEENFYKYLTIALEKNCPVWNYLGDYAFKPYKDTTRFQKLIEPYKKRYSA